MGKIDEYIKDNYVLQYKIRCRTLPPGLSKSLEIRNNSDISSRWKRVVICNNSRIFRITRKKFDQNDILYKTDIQNKNSFLAAILYEERGKSIVSSIFWGLIKWIFIILLCILMPLFALKFTAIGAWPKIKTIMITFLRN